MLMHVKRHNPDFIVTSDASGKWGGWGWDQGEEGGDGTKEGGWGRDQGGGQLHPTCTCLTALKVRYYAVDVLAC